MHTYEDLNHWVSIHLNLILWLDEYHLVSLYQVEYCLMELTLNDKACVD